MNKKTIIRHFGLTNKDLADKLGYSSGYVIGNWPETLGARQFNEVLMRMSIRKIKVPPQWLADSVRI